jgi:D-alanyl-D-alanine carboxypeptidase (penicillin-binding protein 5/6)
VGLDAVSYGGSTAGLYAGEQMTVWNLLHGLLLPSGNDAAIALADAVAGSPARFVPLMNAEARRLHLRHTRFLTPNGFDVQGQVTSAHDLAFLARTAMLLPAFARIVRTRTWHAWSADRRILHYWVNLNRLLWMSRAVNGIKTGTTPGAGACLVSSARKDGKWVIAVNLGSATSARFSDGEALLDYGFALEAEPPTTR